MLYRLYRLYINTDTSIMSTLHLLYTLNHWDVKIVFTVNFGVKGNGAI